MAGFHTDALALLGHTQNELSMKRREAIRPSLKKEYAGLCSQNVPVTSLLFGDDLQRQLNNIKANKSQRSGHKGNSSDSGKNRSSDHYYKRPFHSQSHWRNRGDKSKNSKFPLYKKKEGGKNYMQILMDWRIWDPCRLVILSLILRTLNGYCH